MKNIMESANIWQLKIKFELKGSISNKTEIL